MRSSLITVFLVFVVASVMWIIKPKPTAEDGENPLCHHELRELSNKIRWVDRNGPNADVNVYSLRQEYLYLLNEGYCKGMGKERADEFLTSNYKFGVGLQKIIDGIGILTSE